MMRFEEKRSLRDSPCLRLRSKVRAKAIYEEDRELPIRKSHENPRVQMLYKEYFGEPGSHKSHKLLHTHYAKRENYPEE